MDLADRFWRKVDKKDDGCWLWKATVGHRGYGVIGVNGKAMKAHRVAYIMGYSEIPDGMVVMHTCDTPNCVRPGHLKLGSRDDNAKDRAKKGRGLTAKGQPLEQRFWKNIEKTDECWLWKGALRGRVGHGVITVGQRIRAAHRVSYEMNVGPIPDGMVVRHLCNTPNCVRPDHLAVGTRAENSADRMKSKRQAVGLDSGHAKITEDQVIEMRCLYREGVSVTDLAERYGLDVVAIYLAITGKNWAHVPGAVTERMYGTRGWKDRISKGKMGVLPSPEHLAKIRAARAKPRPAEYRRKLGLAHKGVPSWNKGIPMREKSRRRLSEAKKGSIPWNQGMSTPPEVRAKQAAAKKGRTSPRKGVTLSEETRKKISESSKGRIPWNKGKKKKSEKT
jgi:hypothetical protein